MKRVLKQCLLFLICIFSFLNVNAKEINVEVDSIIIKDKSGEIDVTTPSFSQNEIVSNVTFKKLNDSVTYEIVLKNTDNENFQISKVEDNNKNENVSIEYDYDKDIDKTSINKFRVKLTYKKQVLNVEEINIDDLEIDITIVDDAGNTSDITINPKTSDNISLYIIIFVVSLISIIIILLSKKNKNGKYFGFMLIIMAITLPIAVIASQKLVIKIRFDNFTIKGKFEIYPVIFDLNNDESDIEYEVTYGNKISELPSVPSKNGYTFVKWVDDKDNIVDENTIVTSNMAIKAIYSPIEYNITYDLDGGNVSGNPSTYNIESDSFTLINPTKEGLTFAGWTGSNGNELQTSVIINKGSFGDKQYKANYSINPSVAYKVIHKYQNLDLTTYNEIVETLSGPYDNVVKPETIDKEGFTSPEKKTLKIKEDESSELEYEYSRNQYLLTYKDGDNVLSSESIYYESPIIEIANPTKKGHSFANWDEIVPLVMPASDVVLNAVWNVNQYTISFNTDGGSLISPITQDYDTDVIAPANPNRDGYTFIGWDKEIPTKMPDENITIKAIWEKINVKYTISFNSEGGSDITSIEVDEGNAIGELQTPKWDDHIFVGWYINLSDTDAIDENYIPDGDKELHAKWNKIICKKATSLTSDVCLIPNSSSTLGCRGAGYALGETITFGNIVSSDTYKAGDALLCDVDGTGYNERFYYMRTIEDRAALIYSNNFEGENGVGNTNNYKIDVAPSMLPTTAQWSNLPVTFEDNRAGRFVHEDDLKAAVGKENVSATGVLDAINYIFENTSYVDIDETRSLRSTVWVTLSNGEMKRYHKNTRNIPDEQGTRNGVRPIIEVPLELIKDDYVVHFDPNGGTVDNEYLRLAKGDKLNNLPTPTKEKYIFVDWYTSTEYTTSINENTIPSGYNTYYAKWLLYASEAILNSDSMTIQVGDSSNIVINNSSLLEPYTFESSDDNVVTVDSNGTITAIGEGTAKITIRGTKSNTTKELSITVNQMANYYTLILKYEDGRDDEEMHVDKNEILSTLPSPTRNDYTFAGWYKNTEWENEIKNGDTITSDMNLYAKWMPNNAVCEMNKTYYSSIQTAINTASDELTIIKLVKDVNNLTNTINLTSDANAGKNIVLDLNEHSINYTGKSNVIKTKASIEIKNGIITSSAQSGAIELSSGGKLIMNSGRIEANNERQAIYNNGGTVQIGGTAYLTSNAIGEYNGVKRATVTNASGSMTITGGTIINTSETAVSFKGGSLTIGIKDGQSSTTSPLIIGKTYGISANNNFSFYDGIVRGETDSLENHAKLPDSNIETNHTKVFTTDTYENTLYNTLYLEPSNGN